MSEYTYDAFISYRHRPADMAVAEKLVQLLERLTGPNGKKLHIFRDREELPTESDLGNAIRKGLENSRFLIVICSPSYRESKWCMEELHYFRQLHHNSNARILPILVEGEPDESFPEELRWEERTEVDDAGITHRFRSEIEPLSADVRADTNVRRMRLLRTEYLRIAAPMLGKTFDQLYQRARRRKFRLAAACGSVVMAGLLAFTGYNLKMLNRIEEEHMGMLAMESLRLSVESQKKLAEGDHLLAMLLAMEALPADPDNPDRPMIPEAEAALRSAVYTRLAHQRTAILEPISVFPGEYLSGFYANNRKVALSDPEWMYVYDTETGNLLLRYPSNMLAAAVLNEDGTMIANSVSGSNAKGQRLQTVELRNLETDKIVYTETFLSDALIYIHWDPQEDLWYFSYQYTIEGDPLLRIVRPDGTVFKDNLPDADTWEQIEKRIRTHNSNRNNALKLEYDYTARSGAATELGRRYESQILAVIPRAWKDQSWRAGIVADQQLLLLQNGSNTACTTQVYLLGTGEYITEVTGECMWDSQEQRLFVFTGSQMEVYDFHPENQTVTKPLGDYLLPSADLISKDGTRFLIDLEEYLASYFYRLTGELGALSIYSSDSVESPLLQLEYSLYHVTPDLGHVFIDNGIGQLQLWNIEKKLLLEIPATELTAQLCVSADGSMVAVATCSGHVQVYRVNDQSLLCQFTCPETSASDGLEHMEFEGTKLLLTGTTSDNGFWSQIVDITGKHKTVVIPDGPNAQAAYQNTSDHYLTSDNLLLCNVKSFAGGIGSIYDLDTETCIFQSDCWYQYDEASATLFYIPSDFFSGNSPVLHAARRDKNGIFQDVYTTRLKSSDASLSNQCTDGQYILLSADSCYEVYEIASGNHVMTIYDETLWGSSRLVNGTVITTQFHTSNTLTAYPHMDLSQLLETARSFLTSDLGKRRLTDTERTAYFID